MVPRRKTVRHRGRSLDHGVVSRYVEAQRGVVREGREFIGRYVVSCETVVSLVRPPHHQVGVGGGGGKEGRGKRCVVEDDEEIRLQW